jgi:uncharacterized protein DUF6529
MSRPTELQTGNADHGSERRATLIAALLAGALVAFTLGVYARTHSGTGRAPLTLGFHLPGEMKIWFTRAAAMLAVVQVTSGLRIIGRIAIPRRLPRWFGVLHRASGTVAVALAVPVAYDCVAAFGYQLRTTRIALHGAAGIVLFGAFTAKVMAVQRRHHPGWLVPAAGITLFAALAALWLTSLGWPVSAY